VTGRVGERGRFKIGETRRQVEARRADYVARGERDLVEACDLTLALLDVAGTAHQACQIDNETDLTHELDRLEATLARFDFGDTP
jgi:hypothetical protein